MIELYTWTIEAKPGARLSTELVPDEVRCRDAASVEGEVEALADRLRNRGRLAVAFVVVRDGDTLRPIEVNLKGEVTDG